MRKKYCTPEYEIDMYAFDDSIMTASSGLADGTIIITDEFSEDEINNINGGLEY